MRLIALILVSLTLLGCARNAVRYSSFISTSNISFPAGNEVVIRGIGERLVAQGTKTTGPAIEVLDTVQFDNGGIAKCVLSVPPGSFFKRGYHILDRAPADCYGPVGAYLIRSDGNTDGWCTGHRFIVDICREDNGQFFLAAAGGDVNQITGYGNIKETNKTVERKSNLIQEMIYNGRVGNNLKFIYREFSDSLIRPAFTQEIQYDFSESNIIGFKELRMEILSANNTEIKYKVLKNFPSSHTLLK